MTKPGFVDIDRLADMYRRIGFEVIILPGAHDRAARMFRNTGYTAGVGLLDEHHTAQGTGWSDPQSIEYMTFYAPYPVMVNLYPAKNERKLYICAAGPTYTAGRHPRWFGVPENGGNLRGWSRECPNNGIGERWPDVLQDNILDSSAIDCIFFAERDGWDLSSKATLRRYVAAHYELTTRKIDPWGPCRWNDYRNTFWDMDRFRADLHTRIVELLALFDGSTPITRITMEDELSATYNSKPEKIYDTRDHGSSPIANGAELVVGIGLANICTVNITTISDGPGWLQVSGDPIAPTESESFALLNFDPDRLTSNSWTGAVPNGRLHIVPRGANAHVLVEVLMRGSGQAA